MVASLGLEFSFNKVVPSLAQVAAEFGLYWSTSEKTLDLTHLVVVFRSYQGTTQPAPKVTHVKDRLGLYQSLAKVTLVLWSQPPHSNSPAVVITSPHNQ